MNQNKTASKHCSSCDKLFAGIDYPSSGLPTNYFSTRQWPQLSAEKFTFKNVERIYPTQRRPVAALIEGLLSADPSIQRIIIFGSSVTEVCNPWSDIDAWVEGWNPQVPHPTPNILNNEDWGYFEFDIWGERHPKNIKEEVYRKGVVVYGEDIVRPSSH